MPHSRLVLLVFGGGLLSLLGAGGLPAADKAQAPLEQSLPAPVAVPSMSGVNLSSADPTVHLNYASILFYKGRRLMQEGNLASGEAVFREVEGELHQALTLAEQDPDASGRAILQSQSTFMLGDIAYFVHHNGKQAVEFYRQALTYFPQHDGASEALKRLTPDPNVPPQ